MCGNTRAKVSGHNAKTVFYSGAISAATNNESRILHYCECVRNQRRPEISYLIGFGVSEEKWIPMDVCLRDCVSRGKRPSEKGLGTLEPE
jgi:hypothetical protein